MSRPAWAYYLSSHDWQCLQNQQGRRIPLLSELRKDAESGSPLARSLVKRTGRLIACPVCRSPHFGSDCTNPACYANPGVSDATKTAWAIRDGVLTAEATERDRVARIRSACFGTVRA